MITKFKIFEGNELDPWGEEDWGENDILKFRELIDKLGYNPTDIKHYGKDPHPNGWTDYETDIFYFNIGNKKFSIQSRYEREPSTRMIFYRDNLKSYNYYMREATIEEIKNAIKYFRNPLNGF